MGAGQRDVEQSNYSKLLDVDRLKLLMELTGQMNSNLDLDSLLLDIIKAAKIVIESEASSLFLIDDKTGELVLSFPTGPVDAELSGVRMEKDQGIGGWVISNQQSVIIEDVYEDPRFYGDFLPDVFKTRNLICVPLKNQDGEIIGALQAMNKFNEAEYTKDDLTIFKALANQAAIAIENARLHEERLQKQLLEQQMDLAHSIQSGFWPKFPPNLPGYKISGTSRPATWVGGDYYDFIQTNDPNVWGFALGDVTGKGMPAALLMAGLRSVLRTQVENGRPIAESIARMNNTIYKDTPIDKFITLFYGELDVENHVFQYVNAGHNPPYLLDFNKNELQVLDKGEVMLGIMENVAYTAHEIKIEPGQELVIFSDGVTEAQNSNGEFYDEERFEKWLMKHPKNTPSEIISLILRELEQFRESHPQSDDITLLVIRRED